ncbi:hypothetical protein K7711_19315 [Nocardia sp. CA2R105]|uniref:hypothetical protein n=1 Tax=Nocardia coffeae TaxID=2873381 RepID=UPI001CA75E97|nr:hypothetical protein [Nocardia coffeae]MBY8858637.1 hypothetical protein [Nocardia coffeae]
MNEQVVQRDTAGRGDRSKAVGVVRPEVSRLDAPWHADEVRRRAVRLGYELVYMVRPPQDHADPVGYALGIAAGLGADVVVVYDLGAVDQSPARVCEMFDLETVVPPETWARVHESCSGTEDARSVPCVAETV